MTYNLAETFKSIQQKNQSSESKEDLVRTGIKLTATLIALPIYTTIIWAILTFMFTLSISWLHILGGLMLLRLFMSLVAYSFDQLMS